MQYIDYAPAAIAGQATVATVSSVTETDILKITDDKWPALSQLSIYISQVLATATKITYGYYFSFDGGTNWYKLPVKDLSTNKGELVDTPSYVDPNSPTAGGVIKTLEDIPTSGANAFKVTALANTGTGGALTVTVLARNN